MRERIVGLLESLKKDCDFRNSENYIVEELLDSLDMFEFIDLLERTFHIELSGKDIIPDHFINSETIETLVKKYGGRM